MKRIVPIILTLLLLASLSAAKFVLHQRPAAADAHHAAIRQAIERVPRNIGQWIGIDTPVPEAAVRILHPNAILSRRYENIATGESLSFLIVQVTDARDIVGHFPKYCYPRQGWLLQSATPTQWMAGERTIIGMEYAFGRGQVNPGADVTVDNFLVLPTGETCREPEQVEAAAQDYRLKHFGAAQVQLVYGGRLGVDRRRAITEEFLAANRDVIDRLCSAGKVHQ